MKQVVNFKGTIHHVGTFEGDAHNGVFDNDNFYFVMLNHPEDYNEQVIVITNVKNNIKLNEDDNVSGTFVKNNDEIESAYIKAKL